MGVRAHDAGPGPRRRVMGPGLPSAVAVGALAFALLMANGRPLGAPQETGGAGALVRLALSGAGLVLETDATTRAVLGKGLAALAAALAAGALFMATARRHPLLDARMAGLVLAVGTTLASASHAWSGEVPATAAVAAALVLLARADAEDDPSRAAHAMVPLAVAAVMAPSTWALAIVLAAAALVRFLRRSLLLLVWTVLAAGAASVALVFSGDASPPWAGPAAEGAASLALLVSPGRGLIVFAPVVLVGLAGLVRAGWARPRRLWDAGTSPRWLALSALAAALAHVAGVAILGDGGGPSWGPRLFAPAGPPLLLFLPEGLAVLRAAGGVLVALSVAVQALGAFAYDGRWDRLHGGPGGSSAAMWDVPTSPIAFQIREGALRPSLLALDERRLVVREHLVVLGGSGGSRVAFGDEGPAVTGADPTLEDVLLEGGARVVAGHLRLQAPDDALFFRVRQDARLRRLELRIAGRGHGTLVVEEKTFWTAPRTRERAVAKAFGVRLPYLYAESGGGDLRLLSRGGTLEIASVALVPPGEPENVIRLR